MIIDFENFEKSQLNPQNAFDREVEAFVNEWFSDSTEVSVQTSGSTGVPKIIKVEKEKMMNSARMTIDFLSLNQGDVALLCLPIAYISGKMMVVRSITGKLVLKVEETTSQPLKNLNQKIDFCAMTPLQVENSLEELILVKKIIIGGGAVSATLKNKIFENGVKGQEIFETYGMSETLSHIAMKRIYPVQDDFFTILKGIEISQDERGCLTVFAPQLTSDLLLTNDIVEIFDEKKFRFVGRADNIINSGGVKIIPEKLEDLLKKQIPLEVVISSVKDEILGEKLVLVVEHNENFTKQQLSELLEDINFERSFYKPKILRILKKIPRLPNGKLDRIAVRSLIRKENQYD